VHVWRDRLHRWFEPAARACPLSPNAITLLALGINLAAAGCLAFRHFVAGIVLLAIGGFADAFDGIVARVQQKTSRFGDFLDHFADRISDLALIAGWLIGNEARIELALLLAIAVALNGYIGTQIEATWHERRYDGMGRGEFLLALVVFPIASVILYDNHWQNVSFASLRIAEWMAAILTFFAFLGIVQRLALAVRLERS
jgi:phosphatidylglycerophosphate synthase